MSNLYEIVKCRDANNHSECEKEHRTGQNGLASCDLCLKIWKIEQEMNLL